VLDDGLPVNSVECNCRHVMHLMRVDHGFAKGVTVRKATAPK
jgi:hypothetical protein